jgi:hypothetical protein
MHPPLEVGESLFVAFEACIHASKGAQVPHDHVGMIEFLFFSECIFWVLDQPVSPGGGGVSAPRPLQGSIGASGSWHFFLSYFMTFLHMHPPMEAGESLYVAFEACIPALDGAQIPHDHFRVTEFVFYSECIFSVLHQPVSPGSGGSRHRDPPRVRWGQW